MALNGLFRTLYAKLAAVLLGLLLLIGSSYLALTWFSTRLYLQEIDQKLNRLLAEHLVAENLLMEDGRINQGALEQTFHMMMVINPSIEVYLLDPEGAILSYSAPEGKVKRDRVSLGPIRTFLEGASPFPILGDDPRDPVRRKIFSAAPVPGTTPDRPEGYLYVILGGEQYDSVAQMLQGSYILRLSSWGAAGSLVFALVAGLILFNLLTRRLTRLAHVMDSFKKNDYLERPDASAGIGSRPEGDEIDRLGATFNLMTERIIEQMDKLRKTDRLRRDLVANVSHDLRTPLASLQGYLETLLMKEGSLSPQEQRRYLEIAARHSGHLGRLVGELFELAKLDSHETRPKLEPFSIAELAQDVMQKYRLTAENKKVRFESDFEPNLPFVSADIGLIERVLENLLQNAFRYTDEGGSVSLSLAQEKDRIRVRVSDTGRGIPPDDIPFIFDRFYRSEKSRSESSEGAGLGLAITKRILELHGSGILAESTVGTGTVFTFHLPVYRQQNPSGAPRA